MTSDLDAIRRRIERLEQARRRERFAWLVLLVCGGVLLLPSSTFQAQDQRGVLRLRQLIVEDANGRPRVLLGPLDPPPSTRGVGLRINDPAGTERVAVFLTDSGRASIGLDAPLGKGDDRNPERINMAADEDGGAYIRFLDRRTFVAARLYLDEQNRTWMQFSDFSQKPALIRRYGLSGEEVLRPPQ
jgi:hypothetical protein